MKKVNRKKKKPQKKRPSKALRKQWTELCEGYERHMADPRS